MLHINWLGEVLDTTLSLTGKWGRWLNTRKNRWCFVIWIVCCSYWFCRDIQLHLYSQAFFCLPSIALHAYGFWHWGKDDKPQEKLFTQEEVNTMIARQRHESKTSESIEESKKWDGSKD